MTNEEIIQRGQLINDETEPAQNTSERVGGVIKGIGQNLADKDTAITAEAARNGYYQCTVSDTTLAVTAPGFTLPAHGGNIRIKMSAPATGASTLNINSTGDKALLYNGAAVSSANTWEKDEIISVFYDPSGSGQYLASNSQGGGGKAEKIKYDNTLNLNTEDNVQRALDEVSNDVSNILNALGMFSENNIISTTVAKNTVVEYLHTINKGDVFHVKATKNSGVNQFSVSTRNGSTTVERVFFNVTTNQDVIFKALGDADRFAVFSGGGAINLRIDSVDKNIEIDDVPTSGSNKPVKSGGIYGTTVGIDDSETEADLEIKDENHNVLVLFQNGHIRTKKFDSSKISDISIADNENFDFTVEDENGYAVVIFQRGHIRTKNFNSETFSAANFLKDKFQGKKIAIVGDSISTFRGWLPSDVAGFSGSTYDWYYPRGDVDSVDKTWWYQVAQNLGIPAADIANTSWSGSKACGDSTSTTNGHAGCSTKRINDIAIHGYVPDIIIVYIGCNDWYQCGLQGYNITLGTWAITDAIPAEGTINAFRSAYALMLSKIQNAYPSSRIFCCTILDDWRRDGIGDDDSDNAWPSNDGAGYTTKQWNDNIKEIADAFACDVIDLHNCGITYFNIQQYYAVDAGLHPNAAGHALMARKITSELMAKY